MNVLDQEKKTDDGLTPDEQDYLLGRAPREQRVERKRPSWLVVGLVWATFGLYIPFWVGLNWAELKRQLQDDRMYPVWHAVSMLVPIYSYFRFHANFRVINELLESSRTRHRVHPGMAVTTFILGSALLFFSDLMELDTTLMVLNSMAALAAFSWTIYHGQSGMNAYWDGTPEQKTTDQVKLWERLVIAAGIAMWSLIVIGVFFGAGEV